MKLKTILKSLKMADPAVMRLKQVGPAYQCDGCSYKGTKTQVGHHAVMKHLKLHDVPFLCGLCDKRGSKEAEIRKHCAEKHPGLPVSVEGTKKPYEVKACQSLSEAESLRFYGERVRGSKAEKEVVVSDTESEEIKSDINDRSTSCSPTPSYGIS